MIIFIYTKNVYFIYITIDIFYFYKNSVDFNQTSPREFKSLITFSKNLEQKKNHNPKFNRRILLNFF